MRVYKKIPAPVRGLAAVAFTLSDQVIPSVVAPQQSYRPLYLIMQK